MKITVKMLSLFLAPALIMLNVGCSGGASSSLGIPDLGDGTGGGVLPGTADGIAADSYFYVGVDKTINTIAHVHNATGFSDPCSISSTTASAQDIVCIIEVPEANLHYHGIAFKTNQPADMCNAMAYFPYWYYNKETGKGPTSVTLKKYKTVSVSGDVSWGSTVDCLVGDDGNAGVADAGCDAQTEIAASIDTSSGEVSLACNYGACCLGSYTYAVTTDETNNQTGIPTVSTTLPVSASWGGDVQTCIGGPGRGFEAKDVNNYPIGQIIENPDPTQTHKFDTQISAPEDMMEIDVEKPESNRYAANYFTVGLHNHAGFVSATTSVNPYFVTPIDDRSGSSMPTGQVAYSFGCLDAAQEFKHRISVYVREWNSYADYLVYIASSGATENPDRFVDESIGGSCDGIAGPCDDFYDLDDFVLHPTSGTPYSTTDRRINFPAEVYK